MDVSPTTRNTLIRSIIALTQAADSDTRTLKLLVDLCTALSDYAGDDDHSVAHDLEDYVKECLEVAEGKEDGEWRDELLETLEEDLKNETI
jgi:hypothetical protein